jgi:hypothetical protein
LNSDLEDDETESDEDEEVAEAATDSYDEAEVRNTSWMSRL